jgi:phosphatidylglycerol---prolipoprotein diacylglyceryl transferase
MHPILFHLGDFPLGTYGVLLAIAFFSGTALARRQGKLDGIKPDAITNISVAMLISAIIGAKLLYAIVELSKGTMGLREIFSMGFLRAAGHIHGGIIAATITFFWMMRPSTGLNIRAMGDALVPGVALGQAIGRLGCFMAGCCFGTHCELPWSVTFTDAQAAAFSGTPLLERLHPVQIYTSLSNLIVLALLLIFRRKRIFEGQIMGLYFIFEGIARIVVETWRGDLDRGTWLGLEWLSTGRLTAMGFIALGTLLLALWRRPATKAKA